MARSEVTMVLTDWQKSFLVSAVNAKAEETLARWDAEVKGGKMRRSELIAGMVDIKELQKQVLRAAEQ